MRTGDEKRKGRTEGGRREKDTENKRKKTEKTEGRAEKTRERGYIE